MHRGVVRPIRLQIVDLECGFPRHDFRRRSSHRSLSKFVTSEWVYW